MRLVPKKPRFALKKRSARRNEEKSGVKASGGGKEVQNSEDPSRDQISKMIRALLCLTVVVLTISASVAATVVNEDFQQAVRVRTDKFKHMAAKAKHAKAAHSVRLTLQCFASFGKLLVAIP